MDEVETNGVNETIGEIHILFRGIDKVEVSSTLDIPEMNIALDQVKYALLRGELIPSGIED